MRRTSEVSAAPRLTEYSGLQGASLEDAGALLSQQVWCWGRDILRPQGNWLIEVGFERTAPPSERASSPSLYALSMPSGQTVLLRGFGVFFGDARRGCIYLPRYSFEPCYTGHETLGLPLWTPGDLPQMQRPSQAQRADCASLLVDLIDWIWRYEADIVTRLGVDYRRSTLAEWNDGSRPVIAAEDIAPAWRDLMIQVQAGFGTSR